MRFLSFSFFFGRRINEWCFDIRFWKIISQRVLFVRELWGEGFMKRVVRGYFDVVGVVGFKCRCVKVIEEGKKKNRFNSML